MNSAYLEHANITVNDPDELAALLCKLFSWKVRWRGKALNDGYSVHVGEENSYLALYKPSTPNTKQSDYTMTAHTNHVGIVVDNLEEIARKAAKMNINTFNHADYEPGRRFYFIAQENIEVEVVTYTPQLQVPKSKAGARITSGAKMKDHIVAIFSLLSLVR